MFIPQKYFLSDWLSGHLHKHQFKPSRIAGEVMLEEFCEGNHCDQYIHSEGGSFAQCLMVQRDLSRVGSCPLRYDMVKAKVIPEVKTSPRNEAQGEPARKKGFGAR
jgi:hypothetical protein